AGATTNTRPSWSSAIRARRSYGRGAPVPRIGSRPERAEQLQPPNAKGKISLPEALPREATSTLCRTELEPADQDQAQAARGWEGGGEPPTVEAQAVQLLHVHRGAFQHAVLVVRRRGRLERGQEALHRELL